MGRNADRRGRKRQRYAKMPLPNFVWNPEAVLDDEGMQMYYAIRRFMWLIREQIRNRRRKPGGKKWSIRRVKKKR